MAPDPSNRNRLYAGGTQVWQLTTTARMVRGSSLAIRSRETKKAKARSRRDRWASQRDFAVLESHGRFEESHGLVPWIVRLHATEAADKNSSFFPALKSRRLARRIFRLHALVRSGKCGKRQGLSALVGLKDSAGVRIRFARLQFVDIQVIQ